MKNYLNIALILFASSFIVNAQTTDLARIEYMNIPFSKSDNSIQRYRAFIQAPIPLDKDLNKLIVVGLDYRYNDINIKDAVPFNPDIVSSTQRMEVSLGYVWKPQNMENWRFGVRGLARVASNLDSKITSDDMIYGLAAYAIYDRTDESVDKPYRWIFGTEYTTTPGRSFPLPIVNYYREFAPNWTYTLGVPKTNVRRYLNDSHKDAVQGFVTLDNFFGNIQQNINIDGQTAENISMTLILGGLGYEHYFTDHLLFYGYGAYTISNDFRLRDNDRNDIYTINEDASFYVRGGLKFKF
ncbi:hypothetical protein SAMN05192588_1461 [Nonlabens sp. Hel1_33_55]|uniref:hypothetical protein n=1 Tax=Nonlabens sp. Hel1_33_55 TaxID=1336802 RepID=UPI000875DD25|nr:hypothetical protein [Nonlabens sp. Hel1_33_55]SCY16448.1 hypothetical protein SAMN05192588_1461 [Nonlabens sp. Hel1_33_55]